VIEHVSKIKESFDAAMGIMRSRIDIIKAEFSAQQEEVTPTADAVCRSTLLSVL
jgi:hypothetical protein